MGYIFLDVHTGTVPTAHTVYNKYPDLNPNSNRNHVTLTECRLSRVRFLQPLPLMILV